MKKLYGTVQRYDLLHRLNFAPKPFLPMKQLIMVIAMITTGLAVHAQQVYTKPYTLEEVNAQIKIQEASIADVQAYMAGIQADAALLAKSKEDGSWYKYAQSIEDAKADIKKFEGIKQSIETARAQGLPDPVYTGNPEADREVNEARKKEWHAQNGGQQTLPAEKIKITRAEFNALPEANRKAVEKASHLYEIID